MFHEGVISVITFPFGFNWLFPLKIILIVFALVLFVAVIVLLSKTNWLRYRILQDVLEFFTYRPYETKKLAKQWAKVLARLETGLESEYKLALIEAESIFEDVLKKMGYGGETLGERLKKVNPNIVPNLEEVWSAHKVRNNIVHDPDYRLGLDEAKKTINIFERALVDLGAL